MILQQDIKKAIVYKPSWTKEKINAPRISSDFSKCTNGVKKLADQEEHCKLHEIK